MRLGRRSKGPPDDLERRVVWLLGSSRSGTTWLLNLIALRPGVAMLNEPGIGGHLALFYPALIHAPARFFPAGQTLVTEIRGSQPNYFFADSYADVWRPELRRMIMAVFAAQLKRAGTPRAICLVKEPTGAQASSMLLETCPRSRMLWLLRDGRDVVDSQLDAISTGAWGRFGPWEMTESERLDYIEDRAFVWLRRIEALEEAYERLPESRRLAVRYEALRSETVTELERILRWVGVPASREECERDADRMSFENVAAEHKGKGKFHRSASPGAWRQNLTADEQAVMERVMGAKLRALGYA